MISGYRAIDVVDAKRSSFAAEAFVFVAETTRSVNRLAIEIRKRRAFEAGGLIAQHCGDGAVCIADDGVVAVAEFRKFGGVARIADVISRRLRHFNAGGILAAVGAFLNRVFARRFVANAEFIRCHAYIAGAWDIVGNIARVVRATVGARDVVEGACVVVAFSERGTVERADVVRARVADVVGGIGIVARCAEGKDESCD